MAGQRLFWDRDIDSEGRIIRLDVRRAAQKLFPKAVRMTVRALGDPADAGEILESCVVRLSRYLDDRHHELFTQCTDALLFVAFRHALSSRARKRGRLVAIGSIETLAHRQLDLTWSQRIDNHIDLAKLVARLSKRSRVILALRRAGYEWKEVAAVLGVSVPKAKTTFWREVQCLRAQVLGEARKISTKYVRVEPLMHVGHRAKEMSRVLAN